MGLGEDRAGAVLKKAGENLRAEVGAQLQEAAEVGWKIAEMAEAVNRRLFGPHPQPERVQPTSPVGADVPIESIFIDGIRGIRSAQTEAGATLQAILQRL